MNNTNNNKKLNDSNDRSPKSAALQEASSPIFEIDARGGGRVFTTVVLVFLLCSLLFNLVVLIIAGQSGQGPAAYADRDWYVYLSYTSQVGFIALILVYFFKKGVKPVEVGFTKFSLKYLVVALIFCFGLFCGGQALNSWFNKLFELIGFKISSHVPSLSGGGFALALLVIGLLPPIAEETLFRGFILNGSKGCGTAFAVLISGVLFSLFHCSPVQTVHPFISGCAFALLAVRSGSVFPSMLVHFLNNLITLTLIANGVNDLPLALKIVGLAVLALCFAYLIFVDKTGNEQGRQPKSTFLKYAAVGLAVCIVLWVANLIAGLPIA